MNELFTYLFDENVLKNKLREKWIKLYDFNFVDKEIIGGLLTTKKNISDLLTFIYNKATASNLTVEQKEEEEQKEEQIPGALSIAPSTTLKTNNYYMNIFKKSVYLNTPLNSCFINMLSTVSFVIYLKFK